MPPGFVEPDPEFFSRMAGLAESTRTLLKLAGAFARDYEGVVRDLGKVRDLLEGIKSDGEMLQKLPRSELLSLGLAFDLARIVTPTGDTDSEAHFVAWRDSIERLATDIKAGNLAQYPHIESVFERYSADLEPLWVRLELVCRRLEAIAHKQLRKLPLNANEEEFIKDYGSELAAIMMYGGNSYLTPRDDAPRIADVYGNPQNGGHLHVGIARPRKLYVLYPWDGKTVLCEGAVRPYYELVHGERLTDNSLRTILDSQERPSIPEWLTPVVSGGKLGKAVLQSDH